MCRVIFLRAALTLFALLTPAAAMAQGDDDPHTRAAGPNGGNVEHAGANHIELVVRNLKVRLYVYDKDLKPVAADGAEASVTFQIRKLREIVKLQHGGANLMQGLTDRVTEPGLRVVVTLKMPGQPVMHARFAM